MPKRQYAILTMESGAMDEGETGDGGAPKPGAGNRRRMPPATLDLTAMPAPDAAVAPGLAAGETASPTPSPPESATETPAGPTNSPGAIENPTEVPPPKAGPGRLLAWVAGAAAAAAVVLLALLVTRPWDTGPTPPSFDAAGFVERLSLIEAQVAELAKRPAPVPPDPAPAAALDQRLTAIESQVRAVADRPVAAAGDPNQAAALSARLDDLAKRFPEIDKRFDAVGQVGAKLDDIAGRTSRLETALAAPRPPVSDPALDQRIGALEAALRLLGDTLVATAGRVDEVAATAREADRHAETATATAAAPSAADRAMRLAFLTTALRAAAERGAPFADELAALKPAVADKARLAALEAFATTGLPSEAALSRELSGLLPALTVATTPAASNGGLLDRLHMTTQQMVRVRRVGEAVGDDPAAVVARIDAKAATGDVAGALAEFVKLPPAIRAPAEPWIAKANQRAAALDAAQALAAEALGGLKATP